MATIRDGNKPVLIVVDAQVGVLETAWEAPQKIQHMAQAVETARRQGIPVLWVQHADDELVAGSAAWQLVPELIPRDGETLIAKQYNSSFEQTVLDKTLSELGTTHIVLAGAATNWCIRATAYAALDRGYDLTLIKDAHTTGTITFDDGTCIKAEDMILELNIAMRWLSYPGLSNRTVAAQELDFAA